MAMQRASPMRMSPVLYSGYPRRKITARANISTGPITQFCNSESPSTLRLRKTSPSRSYCTLASGGYIIRISPTAIGMLVVPAWYRCKSAGTPGTKRPRTTPAAMARKIHSVRKRSTKESLGLPGVGAGQQSCGSVCIRSLLGLRRRVGATAAAFRSRASGSRSPSGPASPAAG